MAAYVFLTTATRAPLRIRDWQFPVPTFRLAIAQLVVSAIDWTVSGAVLYALLPHGAGIAFWQLIGAYMLAHAAGLISHSPGASASSTR